MWHNPLQLSHGSNLGRRRLQPEWESSERPSLRRQVSVRLAHLVAPRRRVGRGGWRRDGALLLASSQPSTQSEADELALLTARTTHELAGGVGPPPTAAVS